jgi:hypothetical protein
VVEPAETPEGDHPPGFGQLHRSTRRRVSVDRHMWPVFVIELRILPSAAQKMTFAEDDDMADESVRQDCCCLVLH